MRVLKQSLNVGRNIVYLPRGAHIFHFGWQEVKKSFAVWYEAPDKGDIISEDVKHIMYVAMTGESVPSKYDYYGTAMTLDGGFVTHLFVGD